VIYENLLDILILGTFSWVCKKTIYVITTYILIL